jgi:hypothetical protein
MMGLIIKDQIRRGLLSRLLLALYLSVEDGERSDRRVIRRILLFL